MICCYYTMERLVLFLVICVFDFQVDAGRAIGNSDAENVLGDTKVKQFDFRDINGDSYTEKIRANTEEFVALYQTEGDKGIAYVIDDHARKLRIVRPAEVNVCVVMQWGFDRTFQTTEEFAEWITAENATMSQHTFVLKIDLEKPSIMRIDFLPTVANDLCKSFPIYWGFTLYNSINARMKRQTTTGVLTTLTTCPGDTTTTTSTTTTTTPTTTTTT